MVYNLQSISDDLINATEHNLTASYLFPS